MPGLTILSASYTGAAVRSFGLSLVLIFGTSSNAATDVPTATLAGNEYREAFKREATVSGADDLIGLVAAAGANKLKGAVDLHFRMPHEWRGQRICLRVMSVDGLYEAVNSYHVPSVKPGTSVKLQLNTRHPGVYRTGTLDTLATLATLGDCLSPKAVHLPLTWGAPATGPAGTLRLQVQGAKDRVKIIPSPGARVSTVACKRLIGERLRAFDSVCEIQFSEQEKAPIPIQIERCSFGECARSAHFSVAL